MEDTNTTGKYLMKLTMEIQGHNSGLSDSKQVVGEKVEWASIYGIDNNGRYARAVFYKANATALNSRIASILDEGETVAKKRLIVQMEGEWRTGKPTADGRQNRFFAASKFNILDGLALENARLVRDAVKAIRTAEEFRNAGKLANAYETVAHFVANFAGVPLDLEAFMANSEAEDAEFGATDVGEVDPETRAAAIFAREDGRKRADAPATAKAEEPPTPPEHEASTQVEPLDFATSDDPELGVAEDEPPPEDATEEDSISLESNVVEPESTQTGASVAAVHDVLDDEPVKTAPARTAPATFAARTVPGGSRPFKSPEVSPVAETPKPTPPRRPFAPTGPKFF